MKRLLNITLAAVLSLCLAFSFGGCSILKKGSSGKTGDLSKYFSAKIVRPQKEQTTKSDQTSVTVLVYMNGSDLESESGEATMDLSEMVAAGASDKVNVVVQTMGTKKWDSKYGISSRKSQRYKVNGKGLELVDDSLGQLDTTETSTLQDFIRWGASTYPADRYMLIMWDHGGGPVYGFGYDEIQGDTASLTLDEIQEALNGAGVFFDFIGFDACIMSSLEVCMALYDYCDYLILSEDFESGLGWSYTAWLKQLYSNPTIKTTELGTTLIDAMIEANESNRSWGTDSILTLVDVSALKVLYAAWVNFAYANEDALLNANYSQQIEAQDNSRVHPAIAKRASGWSWANDMQYWDFEGFGYDEGDVALSDYYITDIMSVAQNIDSKESKALSAALDQAIAYTRSTTGDSYLSGLSVTLPYGDSAFYAALKTIFLNCGMDESYVSWLGKFVNTASYNNFYDFSTYNDKWDGWDNFDYDFDWSTWEYTDDDDFWKEFDGDEGWSDYWDYDNSWNSWFEEYYDYLYGDDEDDYYSWYDQYDNHRWDYDYNYGHNYDRWDYNHSRWDDYYSDWEDYFNGRPW